MKIKIPDDIRAERLFVKYEKLALSAARAIAAKYGRSYSELADESLSILARLVVEKWDSFDPSKASACTWIYQKVYFNLANHCVALSKHFNREGTPIDAEPPHRGRTRLEALFAEIGEEGRALLNIIVNAPGDLAYSLSPNAPVRSVNAIRRHLRDEGWDDETTERAWTQLEVSLVG